MVTADVLISERRNTLAAETYLRVGLGSRFYLVLNLAVDGLDLDRTSKGCCCEGDRYCGEDGCLLAHKYRASGYGYLNEKVSSLAAVRSGLSFSCDTDALSVVDTCRDLDLNLLLAGDISGTVAVRALLLDDLTGTSAVRTCLDILYLTEEGLLGVDDLTFTVTFRAGNRRCTRLCACSVTFRTLILQCELDLFLAAKDCLFKCDPYAGS